LIFKHLDPQRDLVSKAVLEIACGRGGLACRLARTAAPAPNHVIAADMSAAAIQKAREFASTEHVTSVQWMVADIHALAHSTATFDTVICCETIEHLPRPQAALAEIARVLKPGGRLLLTTPNYLSPLGLYRGYLRCRGRRFTEMGQPINRFTMIPLTVQWLRHAGLRVMAIDATGHYLPWPGRPPVQIESLNVRLLRWFALHSLVVAKKP
jgi:2-polyprenyl-3-methyl-5-hydroxy-6-metoxy-1,4-benzoquinol methylase